MTEQLAGELVTLTPQERAARHLMDVLHGCNPIELRDSAGAIAWDADEHAAWMSEPGVLDTFSCRDLAQASFRYGTASFRQVIPAELILRHFDSKTFQATQKAVCDRVEDPRARSVWFFSRGVKFGVLALRSQRIAH